MNKMSELICDNCGVVVNPKGNWILKIYPNKIKDKLFCKKECRDKYFSDIKMSENKIGELEKHSVTLCDIRNNLPKIVRTSDKIDATIEERMDAEYHVLYVPLSKVYEAKKDLDKRLIECDSNNIIRENLIYINWVKEYFGRIK